VPPLHATLAEITGFLERHPPFSALSGEALDRLAATAEIEYFPAGTEILRHEGPPSSHLFVVRTGAVELVDDGGVVDVLDEGESFGHPSLLSGLPPAFTVRAREDSLCLLFPAEAAVSVLSDPAGVRYVVATLSERLARAVSRRDPAPWGTGTIAQRVRAPVTCDPRTSIRDAATRMTEAGERSVVVRLDDGGYGIVTDHDLRARVVTGEVAPDAPLETVVRSATPTVSPDRQVFEAVLDMLEKGVEQLVVVDDRGSLLGVVDHAALLDLNAPSPFVVRRGIEHARDVSELAAAVGELPHVAVRLLDASVEPLDVLSTLATTADAVTRRLTDLAIAELGEPPAAWAWLSLGSQARREQTLATDQDNALAYDGDRDEVDPYFAALAERVNGWLSDCGYALCRAGVMARNAGWRLPRAAWGDLFRTWLVAPTKRDVHMAMIGLDLREVAGPLHVEQELLRILGSAPEHPYFLERLGQAALEHRPPLGFLRELVVERTGEHAGTLDLKTVGVGPIVSLARRHALAAGATATGTVARLRAAAAGGTLDETSAQELEEAFVAISRFRLEHQAAQVERGVAPDNHADPRELTPLARRQLKEAFRAVARAQRSLETPVATRIP
jgi:CBS domain-containing protein